MAQAIRGVGVGGDEASALGTNAFGVRRVVFPVSKMRVPDRLRLGDRLRSELDAVRDLLRKAEQYSGVPGAAGKDDRIFAPGAAVEDDDGCRAAELARESKPGDRARLAGRLASMAAALPDHVVAFLQDRRAGDADSRGVDGEIEMDDVLSMKDGALFQLKMLLDKFAPETAPKLLVVDKFAPEPSTPKSRGGRAPLATSGISCLSPAQHQEAGGKLPPVQEEEEEGINICGGVSRIAIRDIAEEYGELVDGIDVQLLSPLQRKYVDLAEEDRYVDICGDASPVVFPAAKTGDSSSSDSDATYTDSSSSISSPEVLLPKENSYCRSGEPVPAPEADPIQGGHRAQPRRPAPETIHIAEPENQCGASTVFAVTKSPPAPTVLPKACGVLAQPPEHAPEAVQNAEPEAPGATVHPITGGAPPPAVLSNENGTSSQPAPEPASPVAANIPEPQEDEEEQPPPGGQTSHLIALAQQERKRRARAKVRQVLLKLERAALPDERIHPRDMELLGISAFEHVVSTVRDARTVQPQVNDGVGLSFSPGGPSILQQLGVFLKPDSGGEEEDEEEQPPPPAIASDGEEMDMDIEDGQIL